MPAISSFLSWPRAWSYRSHIIPWQLHAPLFLVMFAVVSVLNSIPSDGSWCDLTLNQVLEDFGVFIFFMALWSGIYCHFRRTVDLTWLLIIFVVAIGQEEFNLWNKLWQQLCLLFGHEISSSERQRGDVFMMALVFGSLLVRFALGGFKSFFRIHITFFICVFVTFQGWIHFIFPYYIQQHLLNERLTYQKELTATYEGRFRFQCDHLPITCFEWVGDAVPITSIAKHVSTESITQVLQSVGNATTSLTGWLSVVDRGDVEVFRGVDANQKVLVTLYKNHELYRVVVDDEYPTEAHNVISSALLSFATPFALVWFFGGLWVVFMHQARVYRIKYGKQFRAMENHQ